jgi:hypothetical protein
MVVTDVSDGAGCWASRSGCATDSGTESTGIFKNEVTFCLK